MGFKEFWKRELHVALHAQSVRFRVVKWVVILVVGTALYLLKGFNALAEVLLFLAVMGVGLHFFLKWKSGGWTKSWGPYKRIKLDGEGE